MTEVVGEELAAVDVFAVVVACGTVLECVLGKAVVAAERALVVAPVPVPAPEGVRPGKKRTRPSAFPAHY